MRGRGRGPRQGGRGQRQGGREARDDLTVPNDPKYEEWKKSNYNRRVLTFDEMHLKPELAHGIFSYGFKDPSDIQQLAVLPIIQGRNLIAQAQSGTGKTGAFSIGILERIDVNLQETQALVLSHTRELADQTYRCLKYLGAKMKGLRVESLIGGMNRQEADQIVASKPHVISATPGIAQAYVNQGLLRCENINIICLDEADELLSEGFIPQISDIIQYLRREVQILLFSATIPYRVYEIMNQLMIDPVKILVESEITLDGIKQYYVDIGQPIYKWDTLWDLYGRLCIQKAIIFASSHEAVDYLVEQFTKMNFPLGYIHGGLSSLERKEIMRRFRTNEIRVLISSDLLARGIDIQQITLVINFELPKDAELYLHRIGRSGRFGRKGVAINICDTNDMNKLKKFEEILQTQIKELPQDISSILEEADKSVEDNNNKS